MCLVEKNSWFYYCSISMGAFFKGHRLQKSVIWRTEGYTGLDLCTERNTQRGQRDQTNSDDPLSQSSILRGLKWRAT